MMNGGVSDLIAALVSTSGDVAPASRSLIAIGLEVAAPLFDELRKPDLKGSTVWNIGKVLVEIDQGRFIQEWADLFERSTNSDVVTLAGYALGQGGNRKASGPLLEALRTPRQGIAVLALGELRAEETCQPFSLWFDEVLRDLRLSPEEGTASYSLPEDADPSLLDLVPRAVVTLARLGDVSRRALLLRCLRFQSDDPYLNAGFARSEAAAALQHVAVEGMFPALTAALSDELVATEAVEALFLLGTPEAIEQLLRVAHTTAPGGLQNRALFRLEELLRFADSGDRSLEELDGIWHAQRDRFSALTCHRLGQPIDLELLVPLVGQPNRRQAVLSELFSITGERFGYDSFTGERPWRDYSQQVSEWVKLNGSRFEPGALYKLGRKQDLGPLMSPV